MAVRHPHRVGIVDELGSLTYGDLHARSNALAHALRDRGVGEGDSVAVMCRNHRGFVDATVAVAKLGADILYLNTAFAGPQLVEVLHRERPRMVILDEEFAEPLAGAEVDHRILAWTDTEPAEGTDTVESLIAGAPRGRVGAAATALPHVILTSGTTGTPKGAPRGEAGLEAAVAMLDRIPLRFGWTHPHRGAAVPHLGLRPPGPGDAAGVHRRAAPALRRPRTASGCCRRSAVTPSR